MCARRQRSTGSGWPTTGPARGAPCCSCTAGEFFASAELAWLDSVGHFSPLEAPGEFAAAVAAAARTGQD